MQRCEHGELTVGVSLPFALLSDLFERFRKDYGGISIEVVESASAASSALVQQRRMDLAFVTKAQRPEASQSLHLRDERMVVVLPQSHPLAGARSLTLGDLHSERFVLCAEGLGPDIEEYLIQLMAKQAGVPRVQMHRVGLCSLINMVATGFGVTLVVGRPPCTAADGVVIVPLAGRHVIPVKAVWMESNPNPALRALLNIVREFI